MKIGNRDRHANSHDEGAKNGESQIKRIVGPDTKILTFYFAGY
jgi:hypothetical protein